MVDLATTEKRYLRVDEVMILFDVTRRTVYYWIEKKKIPAVNVGGGGYRVPVDGLRERLEHGCLPAAAHPVQTVTQTQ